MHVKTIIWKKLFFLFVVQFLSVQAFADCPAAVSFLSYPSLFLTHRPIMAATGSRGI